MIRTPKTFGSLQYLEYIPANVKGIILYFHGLGEVGKGIDAIEVNEIPELYKNGVEKDFVTLAPYLPSGTGWPKNTIMTCLDMVEMYKAIYKTDKIFVTGLSLGGIATVASMIFAKEKFGRSNYFTAAGILCGKTGTSDMTPFLETPIRWWHGTNDSKLPISNARSFYSKLSIAGGNISLIEYDGMDHNIWGKAYNEEPHSFWSFINQFVSDQPIENDVTFKEIGGEIFAYTTDKRFKLNATMQ